MQDWANRIGMTLQFLSLWFVTPQILGEAKMLDAAKAIRRAIEKLQELLFPS
jgi:hypothetical protein